VYNRTSGVKYQTCTYIVYTLIVESNDKAVQLGSSKVSCVQWPNCLINDLIGFKRIIAPSYTNMDHIARY